MPPESLRGPGLSFVRDESLESFIRNEFAGRGGYFWDAEHGHLSGARIGAIWSNAPCRIRGSVKAGTAEIPRTPQPTWSSQQRYALLHQLFGVELPDFIITLSAPHAFTYDDREFFALLDHELCHCAIATDEFGAPRFSEQTGRPIWTIRPHDVEQFSGTVERWGMKATGTEDIVRAGLRTPRFDWVEGKSFSPAVCGTCGR